MANDTKKKLTQTEVEVVQLLCDGLTNRGIGRRLHIAESTVRWHLKNVFRKLGVRTRTELMGRWLREETEGSFPPSSGD